MSLGRTARRALCALTGVTAGLAAQDPFSGLRTMPCNGQVIDDVLLVAKPPLFRARLPEFLPSRRALEEFVAGAQSRVHTPSRPSAVAPFLLLDVDDRCDERRRAETERVLRAQSYIADARVAIYESSRGLVLLVVETTDEVPVVADVRPRGRDPFVARARLGSPNVAGRGVRAVAGFTDGDGFRHGWNAEVVKFAAFEQPIIASAFAAREPLGSAWQLEATRPFQTDFQKLAWTLEAGRREGYFGFVRPDTMGLALPTDRWFGSAGAIARIGPPGRLFLVGSSLTYERDRPGDIAVDLAPGMIRPALDTRLNGRYVPTRSTRANLLLGWRRLSFLRVAGFDAVEGLQDVRRGIEIGGSIGRGLPELGSDDADWFTSIGASLGTGTAERYLSAVGTIESRYVPGDRRWDASVASGRVTGYWRPAPRHTVVSEVDWAWGQRNRTPFQLLYDDADGGMRGFRRSRAVGGQRVVLSLEDRWYLGRVRNLASVSLAPFADVGRLWAGDVPYGVDTPWGMSVGVGVLGALPPSSQVTFRLDIARRLTPDPNARDWQARVTVRDVGRQFWREPRDVARSRPATVPVSLFTWP